MKNRPLSVPSSPDPVPGVSPNMQKMIKHFSKDKPEPDTVSTPSTVCGKCSKAMSSTQPAVKAMGKVFHCGCFCCRSCHRPLQGLPFYDREGSPQCEGCYMDSLASCSRCGDKITDRVLKAMGKCFHVHCFFCSTCSCTLDGLPFIAGEDNKPYCVQDYHRRFSPLCETCKEPIVPDPDSEETVKLVALGKNFHINCYRCQDCARPLSSEMDKSPAYPLGGRFLCKKCYTKRTKKWLDPASSISWTKHLVSDFLLHQNHAIYVYLYIYWWLYQVQKRFCTEEQKRTFCCNSKKWQMITALTIMKKDTESIKTIKSDICTLGTQVQKESAVQLVAY